MVADPHLPPFEESQAMTDTTVDELIADIRGCGDSLCHIQPPKLGTVVTNGGCRCQQYKFAQVIHRYKAALQRQRADIEDLQVQLRVERANRDKLSAAQAEIAEAKEHVHTVDEENFNLKRELTAAQAEITSLNSELSQRDSDIHKLQDDRRDDRAIIERLRNDAINKVMTMPDAQINALCRIEGSNPNDVAKLATNAMEIAALKVDLTAAKDQAAIERAAALEEAESALAAEAEKWREKVLLGYVAVIDDCKAVIRAIPRDQQAKKIVEDARRLDWLERHNVQVCELRRYGWGKTLFWATLDLEDETSDLRSQIDAAIASRGEG